MFTPSTFPPAVQELLTPERFCPLGPGKPNAVVGDRLAALTPEALLAPHPIRDADMARACLAGLWLLHDFLDESHNISQEIATPTGSFWHGIMHRREMDYWNSKYWFRRVGRHPLFEPLRSEAANMSGAPVVLPRHADWDPFVFVDLCEASVAEDAPAHELCLKVQQIEWRLLFDWCYRHAIEL